MESNYSNDYKKGFQDGLNNRTVTMVIKMLQKDLDKTLISEVSELSNEQITMLEETLLLNQHKVDQIVEDYQTNHYTK